MFNKMSTVLLITMVGLVLIVSLVLCDDLYSIDPIQPGFLPSSMPRGLAGRLPIIGLNFESNVLASLPDGVVAKGLQIDSEMPKQSIL